MPRYRLTVEYDGSPFVGWQRQDNGPSVQAALEAAVARFCGERPAIVAAGRTDAGVHAWGQVAHLDLVRPVATATLRDAVNFHLRPAPVAVIDAAEVSPDFHARFSATERCYRYRILNRMAPPAIRRGRVWWVRAALDLGAMAEAASILEGAHDFTTFRSTMCHAPSPEKTLDRLRVERRDDEVLIEARARSFLHNQVRILVGTLRLVGEHRWPVEQVGIALAARNRAAGGPTAPPDGLYLVSVRY
ncbi:tRNA pseudouridine(38-40) synthase TruA [Defluviicoccus vanus]|uniref:tRNA pseudouridine synthase A n=1 Tax=Defluviicoccus vanus TaxID=111831 RepID=A0A7H1N4L3_9PROT|nr:tRNA pseudouridine(38-40) synthase TruA [Defluviicoccus vanus]QNT70649.1 tRNA pseudouridine(38-40) synthase TruA [Defluviicoccus vanus]